MTKNLSRLFVMLFALSAIGVRATSQEHPVNPESLLSEARKLQEIWTAGTPPFSMRAEIQVLNAQGKIAAGQYVVNWVSPARWREELQLANYTRLRVHDDSGYWQQSTFEVQPEVIFQLDTLLDPESVLKIKEKEVLGKAKNRSKDGVQQWCADVKSNLGTARILCFDTNSGNLLSVEYPQNEHQNPPDISRIEYRGFDSVGERRIPFEIRALRQRTSVITVKVLAATPNTQENASLFVQPENSVRWVSCADMRAPELVNRVSPQYPVAARQNREEGRVVFYAVVEADGTLSRVTLIQHATPALESAAGEAIRQWRYKPAACGSTSIRLETSISSDFHLEQ